MSDGIAMVKMLLGLPGMNVLEVTEGDDELVIKVEKAETIGWCPGCARKQHESSAKVADGFGLSRGTVSAWVSKLGLVTRPRS